MSRPVTNPPSLVLLLIIWVVKLFTVVPVTFINFAYYNPIFSGICANFLITDAYVYIGTFSGLVVFEVLLHKSCTELYKTWITEHNYDNIPAVCFLITGISLGVGGFFSVDNLKVTSIKKKVNLISIDSINNHYNGKIELLESESKLAISKIEANKDSSLKRFDYKEIYYRKQVEDDSKQYKDAIEKKRIDEIKRLDSLQKSAVSEAEKSNRIKSKNVYDETEKVFQAGGVISLAIFFLSILCSIAISIYENKKYYKKTTDITDAKKSSVMDTVKVKESQEIGEDVKQPILKPSPKEYKYLNSTKYAEVRRMHLERRTIREIETDTKTSRAVVQGIKNAMVKFGRFGDAELKNNELWRKIS